MRDFFKSLIFNIAFYGYMVIGCFGLIWVFVLPRAWAAKVVRTFFQGVAVLERGILGLDYRVSGLEHLPADGRYIIAMKHQSAYETLKLMPIFGDIAVILKRELSWIPLWGWYTIKTGMIPVDRGARGRAMDSIIKGARRASAQGRHVVIYPQGTRVAIDADARRNPYKIGVARLAEALDMPIVPVALNSGVFWAKKAFIKRGGVVDFRILPPIAPQAKATDTLALLQDALERESDILRDNAQLAAPAKPAYGKWLAAIFVLAALWCGWWLYAARQLQDYIRNATFEGVIISSPYQPEVSGFPFRMKAMWPDVRVITPHATSHAGVLLADGWPVPFAPVHLNVQGHVRTHGAYKGKPYRFDVESIYVRFVPMPGGLHVKEAAIKREDSSLHGEGSVFIPFDAHTDYEGLLQTSVTGIEPLVADLRRMGFLDDMDAMLIRSLAQGLAQAQAGREDVTLIHTARITLPLRILESKVYAGPIRVFKLRRAPGPESD